MESDPASKRAAIPAVGRILEHPEMAELVAVYGRDLTVNAVRTAQDEARSHLSTAEKGTDDAVGEGFLIARAREWLEAMTAPSLVPVFNLTGTVSHTNLGRAVLPREAIDAMVAAAAAPSNLEFDLTTGRRGDRDDHVESWLTRLTGAEAATVVNNNAAAVLLVLNTLARRKEVPVSRGELIEIGGAFRIPDIMARAGCRLVEVGTTNRTHLKDYEAAAGPRTALLMKVHNSNYRIEGFVKSVPEADLARLAHACGVPFVVDLGSGMLVDLARYGLPHEPTPAETLAAGADLVTFSGDKLLGGPQAGLIVGRADLIDKIKRNPMKRAMRLDKVTIAALEAVLRLYAAPEQLPELLPTLRLLTRPAEEIQTVAEALAPVLGRKLEEVATVATVALESQIGSGAFPTETLPSAGVAIRPRGPKRGRTTRLNAIAAAFRALPVPVIGHIKDGVLFFDCRCLEDPGSFLEQLDHFEIAAGSAP